MHGFGRGKISHREMRKNSPTLAGYDLDLPTRSRGPLGTPQFASILVAGMAKDHPTWRRVNLKVARVSVHLTLVPIVLILITLDVTVPRLHHIIAAAMVREVREVKARARVRHSIVIRVKRI